MPANVKACNVECAMWKERLLLLLPDDAIVLTVGARLGQIPLTFTALDVPIKDDQITSDDATKVGAHEWMSG